MIHQHNIKYIKFSKIIYEDEFQITCNYNHLTLHINNKKLQSIYWYNCLKVITYKNELYIIY